MINYLLLPILLLHTALVSADTGSYPLLQVEDGDTLVIEVSGSPTRVQLLGIDAPEDVVNPKLKRDATRTGKSEEILLELGRQATRHLQRLVASATEIDIKGDLKHRDKYGRVPVVAFLPEEQGSLNSAMVQQGYAITLSSYTPGNQTEPGLRQLEQQAREEAAGLWKSNPELMQSWSGRTGAIR